MKGFWKMLTGQGEAEYRAEHQAFRDCIPDDFPFVVETKDGVFVRTGPRDRDWRPATREDYALPTHPAYVGPMAQTSDGFNYRRATSNHGPMPKGKAPVHDDDYVAG